MLIQFINTFAKMFKQIRMKKIAILLGLSLIISVSMQAQKNKRTSAFMYNRNGEYKKAKEAIDAAVLHEKTIHDAKTWLYCGEIYYNIAASQDSAINALAPNAADVAFEAFNNVKKYDTKNTYEGELALNLINLTNLYYHLAADGYNSGDYDAAIDGYQKVVAISELDGRFDTIAAYDAGMASVLANKPELAAKYFQKCVDVDFRNPSLFIYYSKSAKQLGDTTRAFEILALGRERFPEEKGIQLEETQLYLETGKNDQLIRNLEEAIAADPTNANLYRILGQTYENIGETEKAIDSYEKAIEIQPDFSDAIYNIGAIYVNQASELYLEANDLPFDENEKYTKLHNEADEYLKLALPYLEKSVELNPDDAALISALKSAYTNLKMMDKLKNMNTGN